MCSEGQYIAITIKQIIEELPPSEDSYPLQSLYRKSGYTAPEICGNRSSALIISNFSSILRTHRQKMSVKPQDTRSKGALIATKRTRLRSPIPLRSTQ